MHLLQIRSADAMVWRATRALKTSILAEAMQVADRLAGACRRTSPPSRNATRTWVVEITGATGGLFYRASVLRG